MASALREPLTKIWGQSLQRGPGPESLIRGQGVTPPEAESTLSMPQKGRNLARCPGFLGIFEIGSTEQVFPHGYSD